MSSPEKTRKFQISWFDIALLVLILAIAAGAYVLSHRNEEVTAQRTCSYQLEFPTLQEDLQNCVSVGDSVTDTVKNYDMGTVTAVEVKPAMASATDEDAGVVRQAELPGYVTLYVTVETEVTESDSAISTLSGYTLREGATATCLIGRTKLTGYLVVLDRTEEGEN